MAGVCRTLQAAPAYPAIPIVLMSAAPEALKEGDCPYQPLITKPFDLDNVLPIIAGLIGLPTTCGLPAC